MAAIDRSWEVLVALLLVLLVCWFLWKRWSYSGPPGPLSLPLVGHLHLLAKGPAPNILLMQLSQKYGPVMSMKFGSVPVVVISSKDAAREVLKAQDNLFASRPPTTAGRLLFYNYQNLGFIPYGERWRQLRKLCTLELFTSRRIDSFKEMRMQEVTSLLRLLASSNSNPVDVRTLLSQLTFNVISQMLIGKRYFGENARDSSEGKEFIHVMEELFEICGAFSIGEYLPWIRWLDLDNIEARFRRVSKAMDEFLGRIIQDHETRGKTSVVEDFVDVMLRLRDNGEPSLQGDAIKAILIDLFSAGADTSLVALEWALAELIKQPNCMKKLQEEINKAVGNHRLVEEQDICSLSYLQAVVKETFRLHPPAPLLIPHFSMETCNVLGCRISKGTTVLINVYAIARDPCVWEEPLMFNPDRFLPGGKQQDVDIRGQDFEVLPFGSGRRVCPGIAPGLASVHLALANLVHAFDWETPPGEQLDTVKEKYGLTVPMASKLWAVPSARLNVDLGHV